MAALFPRLAVVTVVTAVTVVQETVKAKELLPENFTKATERYTPAAVAVAQAAVIHGLAEKAVAVMVTIPLMVRTAKKILVAVAAVLRKPLARVAAASL